MTVGGTSDLVLFFACFGVSFCTVSPSVCQDDIKLSGHILRERAAYVLFVFCLIVILVISHFGFEGGINSKQLHSHYHHIRTLGSDVISEVT